MGLPILVIGRFERNSRRLGTFLSFFGSRAHLTSLWLVERKGGELGASRTSSIILSTAKHFAPGVKNKYTRACGDPRETSRGAFAPSIPEARTNGSASPQPPMPLSSNRYPSQGLIRGDDEDEAKASKECLPYNCRAQGGKEHSRVLLEGLGLCSMACYGSPLETGGVSGNRGLIPARSTVHCFPLRGGWAGPKEPDRAATVACNFVEQRVHDVVAPGFFDGPVAIAAKAYVNIKTPLQSPTEAKH